MSGECACAEYQCNMCLANKESPYDEVSHKIDNNILCFKLNKNGHRVQTVNGHTTESAPTIDINCLDTYGKGCKRSCPIVDVIHNQAPPPKKPEEEMLLLKTIRQITPTDDMKYTLEVEFKAPRNYTPLPHPGPPPPIITPKEPIIIKKSKHEDKSKKKRTKKKKKK